MTLQTEPARAGMQQAIRRQTSNLLEQASPWFERHSITPPDPIIRFDLRGLSAGQAIWRHRDRPILRFNLDFAEQDRAVFLSQTVPHEVAHIVVTACFGRTQPHGPEWRQVMAFFGLPNADRCHAFPIAPGTVRRQRRWSYVCGCMTHELSTTRHRRAESGRASYHCRHCGEPLRSQHPDRESSVD